MLREKIVTSWNKIKEADLEVKNTIVSGVVVLVLGTWITYYGIHTNAEEAKKFTKEGYYYENFVKDYRNYLTGGVATKELSKAMKCTNLAGNTKMESVCYFRSGKITNKVKGGIDKVSKAYIIDNITTSTTLNYKNRDSFERAKEGILKEKDRERYTMYYEDWFKDNQDKYIEDLEKYFNEIKLQPKVNKKVKKILERKVDYIYEYGALGSKELKLLMNIDSYIIEH